MWSDYIKTNWDSRLEASYVEEALMGVKENMDILEEVYPFKFNKGLSGSPKEQVIYWIWKAEKEGLLTKNEKNSLVSKVSRYYKEGSTYFSK